MSQVGRVAVVTGGGSGLGESIAVQLGRDGHRVAVLDINGEGAEMVAAEIRANGGQAVAVQGDVAEPDSITTAFGTVRSAYGPVGILVTSAALGGFTRFYCITLEEWNRYLAVNLTGTFLCMQNVLPDMVGAEWGRIVTISSAAGQKGASRQGHYSATKGGVIALTKSVALDYAAKGITVNTVPPFVVDTPMLREQQRENKLPPAEFLYQGHSGRQARHRRGHCRGVWIPGLRCRWRRHRPGDRCQRRRGHLTTSTEAR